MFLFYEYYITINTHCANSFMIFREYFCVYFCVFGVKFAVRLERSLERTKASRFLERYSWGNCMD